MNLIRDVKNEWSKSTIDKVDKMDVFDKQRYYAKYVSTCLGLYYNFNVTFSIQPIGHGKPDEIFLGIGIRRYWKEDYFKPKSFEWFCSIENTDGLYDYVQRNKEI